MCRTSFKPLFFAFLAAFVACNKVETRPPVLPEDKIVIDDESGMTAQYVYPTTRYDHGILGDQIEAAGLWVTSKGRSYEFLLPENQVFEDIQPRLFDLDGDHFPEIITILTQIDQGASVAVFKLERNELRLLAQSAYIGRTYRWLNIAAVNDLDYNGEVELAWVSTPHIGGVLKVAHVAGNQIVVVDSIAGVTNHKIYSTNQDLSVVVESKDRKTLYLPANDFSHVLGLGWKQNHIITVDTVLIQVNAELPLAQQLFVNN